VNFTGFAQSGTLTLPVEDYGVLKSPNPRGPELARDAHLEARPPRSVRGMVDVLNLLNAAPPYAVTYSSGTNSLGQVVYGQWSQILSPRILKGGRWSSSSETSNSEIMRPAV